MVVTEWLGLDDVAILDTAICSKLLRPQLLALLAKGIPFCHFHNEDMEGKETKAVEWAAKRRVKLRSFSSGSTTFDSKPLHILKVFTKLEQMNISFIEPTNPSLQYLFSACKKSVRDISIRFMSEDSFAADNSFKFFEFLSECKSVEYLKLGPLTNVSDENMLGIGHLVNLVSIALDGGEGVQITDETLRMLTTECKKMKEIELDSFLGITGKGIATICNGFRNLRVLKLSNTINIKDDELLDHCFSSELSKLEELTITNVEGITSKAIFYLCHKSHLLKKLEMGNIFCNDIKFTNLSPNILSISLDFVHGLTDKVIESIAINCPNLETITLRSMSTITDNAVEYLAINCPLTSVTIYNMEGIYDKSLKVLTEHCAESLEKLDIDGDLTDGVIREVIARCNKLKYLKAYVNRPYLVFQYFFKDGNLSFWKEYKILTEC